MHLAWHMFIPETCRHILECKVHYSGWNLEGLSVAPSRGTQGLGCSMHKKVKVNIHQSHHAATRVQLCSSHFRSTEVVKRWAPILLNVHIPHAHTHTCTHANTSAHTLSENVLLLASSGEAVAGECFLPKQSRRLPSGPPKTFSLYSATYW